MKPGGPLQEPQDQEIQVQGNAGNAAAKRVPRTLLIISSIVLLGCALTYGTLQLVGHWLVREDPLHNATAIAVLTGNMPVRALEAAELYNNGYAKEIWLTHPDLPRSAEGSMMQVPSEDEQNVEVLRERGVPAKAIHIFDTPIKNTADELDVIGAALKNRQQESVIIVTNKSHTRRVHTLWSKFHAADGQLMVHAVSDDDFPPSSWWLNSGASQQVLHEILGLANTWAGTPVQTSARPGESVSATHLPVGPKPQ